LEFTLYLMFGKIIPRLFQQSDFPFLKMDDISQLPFFCYMNIFPTHTLMKSRNLFFKLCGYFKGSWAIPCLAQWALYSEAAHSCLSVHLVLPLSSYLLFSYPPLLFTWHGIAKHFCDIQDVDSEHITALAVARSVEAARWAFCWFGTAR
jgi:hypothetical protein